MHREGDYREVTSGIKLKFLPASLTENMLVIDGCKNTRNSYVVAIAKITILAPGLITTSFLNRSDKNRQSKKLLGLGQITLSSTAENSRR
jgi:hypothetical protein